MRDDDSANRWSGVREAPTAPSRQLTGAVVIIALVAAISGMLYGYDTGVISWALLQLTQDFNITEGWQQVIAASILLGAVAGALTCSWLSDLRGRRGTLLMLAVVFIVGALWCADAADSVMLSLGRLVLGFAVGGATQTAPMYVAELAPPAYRGRLVLCFQIAIGVGILTATLVGAGGSISWRGRSASPACPRRSCCGCCCASRKVRAGWSKRTTETPPAPCWNTSGPRATTWPPSWMRPPNSPA